jgi:radical SAM-linked protein
MMRFWERAMRRAQLPVSYSEGFSPHAQIALAAPLPVGLTSEGEVLDLFLKERIEPEQVRARVQEQLPAGMRLTAIEEVESNAPSVQSLVRAVEYRLLLNEDADRAEIAARIAAFLALESFPWEHKREKDVKRYDLRPLVVSLSLEEHEGAPVVDAVLRAVETASARPDQLASALKLLDKVTGIHRVRLVLAGPASTPAPA